MKVALVWNHPSRLVDCSFRFEQYLAGFERLGHQAFVVCREGAEEGFVGAVHRVPELEALARGALWRSLAADVAVIVTWLGMTDVLGPLGSAGTRIVAIADSDGLIGLKRHPWLRLSRLWAAAHGGRQRRRALGFWVRQLLTELPGRGPEERQILASAELSDAIVFGDAAALAGFRRFVAPRSPHLDARATIVPWAVAEPFLLQPLERSRARRLVAVGRWSSVQKDARLLGAALARHLAAFPDDEVVLFGEGGENAFSGLPRSQAEVRGTAAFDEVARCLAGARTIVFGSRWEGHPPHAAFEALACGCTVVGPPIPAFESGLGGAARASRRRTTRSLTVTLAAERQAWERGERDPEGIAGEWRRRLAPEAICEALLAALGQPRELQ